MSLYLHYIVGASFCRTGVLHWSAWLDSLSAKAVTLVLSEEQAIAHPVTALEYEPVGSPPSRIFGDGERFLLLLTIGERLFDLLHVPCQGKSALSLSSRTRRGIGWFFYQTHVTFACRLASYSLACMLMSEQQPVQFRGSIHYLLDEPRPKPDTDRKKTSTFR